MNCNLFEVLKDLFEEKKVILEKIKALDENFTKKYADSEIDFVGLDSYIDDKGALLDEIEEKNTRTDEIIAQIRDKRNGSSYEDKQAVLLMNGTEELIRKLIAEVNALCDDIRKNEQSCKQKTDAFLEAQRGKIGNDRRSSRVALSYYKVQNNIGASDIHFMDNKK